MNTNPVRRGLMVGLIMPLLLAACSTSSNHTGQTGTFKLSLSSANLSGLLAQSGDPAALGRPKTDLSQIAKVIVNLDHIELVSSGGVLSLQPSASLGDSDGDGHKDLDLKALSGVPTPIVEGAVPAGSYKQFRIFSPSESGSEAKAVYLLMKDGSKIPLRIPSGQQTGLKIVLEGSLEVAIDATTSLNLAFDLAHSLVVTGNGKYMLKPVVKATGDVTSGAVVGTVTFKGTPVDAGVIVSTGNTTIATARAGVDGKYSIAVLAAPASYDFTFAHQLPSGVIYTATKTGVAIAANTTTVVDGAIDAPTGGISGVVSFGGVGVVGAMVEIRQAGAGGDPLLAVTTDALGQYVFPTLEPGAYDLKASATISGAAKTGSANNIAVTDGVMSVADMVLN